MISARILSFLLMMTLTSQGVSQTIDGNGLLDKTRETPETPAASVTSYFSSRNQTGIPCQGNNFWGINANGQVSELVLNGNSVTSNGIVVNATLPGFLSAALAFGNDIDGGSFSPTFYSALSGNDSYIFNGNSWIPLSGGNSCAMYNAAGIDSTIYFHYNGTSPWCIEKYIGGSFVVVYTDTATIASVADIATDEDGNIWFFTGSVIPSLQTFKVTAINPGGAVIADFQFLSPINTSNAYGSFMLNGILYIGFGSSNPNYPNSIVPIYCSAGVATPGTAIPVTGTFSDLASCNPGSPLTAINLPNSETFSIYPNPAREIININCNNIKDNFRLFITDALGKLVYNKSFYPESSNTIQIPVSGFPIGIYTIQVITEHSALAQKLVIK